MLPNHTADLSAVSACGWVLRNSMSAPSPAFVGLQARVMLIELLDLLMWEVRLRKHRAPQEIHRPLL